MSDQPIQTPWSPFNLDTEENRAILKTSETIDQAMARIQKLALHLSDNGSLSEQDVRWLIRIGYSTLLEVYTAVRLKEYIARPRQEQSQSTVATPPEPADLPPYEPVPVPEWLQELQQNGGW